MSRISPEDVWRYRFGRALIAKCPCCGVRDLHRDGEAGKHRDWERGHIIPDRLRGPDMYENLQPLCLACNNDDKQYDSTYHYMALGLGLISVEEADRRVAAIWEAFDRVRLDPEIETCIAFLKDGITRCKHKKKLPSLCCKVHIKKVNRHLTRYALMIASREIERLEEQQKQLKAEMDEEMSEIVRDLMVNYLWVKRRSIYINRYL